MKFIKSDDQTLYTIARLAAVEPDLAKQFALKSRFYDQTVAKETVSFWQDINESTTVEQLTETVSNYHSSYSDSDMIDKLKSEFGLD